jgi:MFS family permease
MVATWGTHFAFGVFFIPVLTEFGWTRAVTSGAFSLSMITQGLLGIVMGGLTDRLGPRVVLTLCGFLLGLGFLLMSQISAVWQLYLFYGVLIGTSMSGTMIPLLSTVARWFVKRRSMMTGIVMTGTGIGILIAAPVASRLISTYDWRTAYIILGSTALVVVVLAAQLLKRDPTRVRLLTYDKNKQEEPGLKLGIEGFSLKEAVHTRQFWLVLTAFFCLGFSLFAIMVHIVPHATELGISATSAASILATIGGLSIVGRLVLGAAADRIGNRRVLIIGFMLMSASLFWLVPATEEWMLYLFAIIFGFAGAGVGVAHSPLVARLFGLRSHGLIFGAMSLGPTIGGAVGPLVVGYVFDATGSYRIGFLVSAVLGVVGVMLLALLTQLRQAEPAQVNTVKCNQYS